jgi:hypothetical protein
VRRGHPVVAVVHPQLAVERDPHGDHPSCERIRHRVAVAAHVDEGVPADLPLLPVRGVVAGGWQGLQLGGLAREALAHDFLHRTVQPLVRFLAKPLLCQLVQVRPALEAAVAHEKVVLHVA